MILKLLKKLIPGASAVSNLTSLGAISAALLWFGEHKTDTIIFTYEQLGIFAGVLYVIMEINRKTPTTQGNLYDNYN